MNTHKVSALLNIFQASLFGHLISVSRNKETLSYIGRVPDTLLSAYIKEESLEQSENKSLPDSPKPDLSQIIIEVDLQVQSHGKLIKSSKTVKNDSVNSFEPCRGIRKPPSQTEDLKFEYQETGQIKRNAPSSRPKVLQRLGDIEPKPAKFVVPQERAESPGPSLYGEVLATSYSQGGDGFALHAGDFVTVLQFLHEFDLVECKWQGLKGLFPKDKVRILARPSDSLNSSMNSIMAKQFLSASRGNVETIKGSKLMSRIKKAV